MGPERVTRRTEAKAAAVSVAETRAMHRARLSVPQARLWVSWDRGVVGCHGGSWLIPHARGTGQLLASWQHKDLPICRGEITAQAWVGLWLYVGHFPCTTSFLLCLAPSWARGFPLPASRIDGYHFCLLEGGSGVVLPMQFFGSR